DGRATTSCTAPTPSAYVPCPGRSSSIWLRSPSGHVLAPVHRPQRDEERREAEHEVHDDERDPHPDAEREQRGPRGLVAEQVEQERLLGADPGRADRQERG